MQPSKYFMKNDTHKWLKKSLIQGHRNIVTAKTSESDLQYLKCLYMYIHFIKNKRTKQFYLRFYLFWQMNTSIFLFEFRYKSSWSGSSSLPQLREAGGHKPCFRDCMDYTLAVLNRTSFCIFADYSKPISQHIQNKPLWGPLNLSEYHWRKWLLL